MTCSSCAARVEKKLNRMPGVEASVNFATERARVVLPQGSTPEDAVATVEATGYTARLREQPGASAAPETAPSAEPDAVAELRRRVIICAALTLPVVAFMFRPLQFDTWQWLSLTLAAPVVVWGTWPFHRGRVAQRPARGRHDGHADQRRGDRGVRLVAVRPVLR